MHSLTAHIIWAVRQRSSGRIDGIAVFSQFNSVDGRKGLFSGAHTACVVNDCYSAPSLKGAISAMVKKLTSIVYAQKCSDVCMQAKCSYSGTFFFMAQEWNSKAGGDSFLPFLF